MARKVCQRRGWRRWRRSGGTVAAARQPIFPTTCATHGASENVDRERGWGLKAEQHAPLYSSTTVHRLCSRTSVLAIGRHKEGSCSRSCGKTRGGVAEDRVHQPRGRVTNQPSPTIWVWAGLAGLTLRLTGRSTGGDFDLGSRDYFCFQAV